MIRKTVSGQDARTTRVSDQGCFHISNKNTIALGPAFNLFSMKKRQTNTAAFIRQQIEAGEEAYWRHTDFAHLPSTAVSKALSRLAANRILERVSKGNSLETEDETSFEMDLLHFRRTFVEKLFAIHSKVMEVRRSERSLKTYARHYYNLFCLACNNRPRLNVNFARFIETSVNCQMNLILQTAALKHPKSYPLH
jgi:hypothetical protein